MSLYLGLAKIYIRKLLQPPLQKLSSTKALLMDLELKVHQQIKDFHLAINDGQTEHWKHSKKKKKLQTEGNNYTCALCVSNCEEPAMHLFFTFSFAKRCCQSVGLQWDNTVPFFEMLQLAKQTFNHKCFMEIVIIATWKIWKQRNDVIFENCPASFNTWKRSFKDECLIQVVRMKEFKRPSF